MTPDGRWYSSGWRRATTISHRFDQLRTLPRFPHGPAKQCCAIPPWRLQIRNGLRGRTDRVLIIRGNCLRDGKKRRLIAKVISSGAHLLIELAAMHVTSFHVDPKRRDQRKRKPSTKNQRRENQPASRFVSQKSHEGGHSADDQEHQAEHHVRFAGTAQHACDGDDTHNRVSGGGEPEHDLKYLPDHGRRFISP